MGQYSTQQYVQDTKERSIEEQLFDALAAAKMATATFAMHLPRKWRDRFFQRLDQMHEPSDWEADDELLETQSVRTFLRAWLLLKPKANPGFGISAGGNLVAAWAHGDRRLTLEFLPRDLVSWLVMIPHREDAWVERGAGTTKLSDVSRFLSPFGAMEWMYAEKQQGETASG